MNTAATLNTEIIPPMDIPTAQPITPEVIAAQNRAAQMPDVLAQTTANRANVFRPKNPTIMERIKDKKDSAVRKIVEKSLVQDQNAEKNFFIFKKLRERKMGNDEKAAAKEMRKASEAMSKNAKRIMDICHVQMVMTSREKAQEQIVGLRASINARGLTPQEIMQLNNAIDGFEADMSRVYASQDVWRRTKDENNYLGNSVIQKLNTRLGGDQQLIPQEPLPAQDLDLLTPESQTVTQSAQVTRQNNPSPTPPNQPPAQPTPKPETVVQQPAASNKVRQLTQQELNPPAKEAQSNIDQMNSTEEAMLLNEVLRNADRITDVQEAVGLLKAVAINKMSQRDIQDRLSRIKSANNNTIPAA